MLEKQAILAKSLLLQLFLQVNTVCLVMNQPKYKNLTLVQLVCLTLNTFQAAEFSWLMNPAFSIQRR
jgi:hypothetical protein